MPSSVKLVFMDRQACDGARDSITSDSFTKSLITKGQNNITAAFYGFLAFAYSILAMYSGIFQDITD